MVSGVEGKVALNQAVEAPTTGDSRFDDESSR